MREPILASLPFAFEKSCTSATANLRGRERAATLIESVSSLLSQDVRPIDKAKVAESETKDRCRAFNEIQRWPRKLAIAYAEGRNRTPLKRSQKSSARHPELLGLAILNEVR